MQLKPEGATGHQAVASAARPTSNLYQIEGGRLYTDGIEVVATHHCNLRCRACAYLAPVQDSAIAEPLVVQRDLASLSSVYHASEARVLGGEPLLHPDLPAVLRAVRSSGISDTIRVITNGQRLPRVPDAFWEAIDEVSVSVYPGKEPSPTEMAETRASADRHGVRLRLKYFHYFRESYSECSMPDKKLVELVYGTCQMAHVWRCHTYWAGRLYRCPQSLFLPLALGDALDVVEGLPIQVAPDVRQLLGFLESSVPLASCGHCLGSVGRLIPNQQRRRHGWREPQRTPAAELIDWPHLEQLRTSPGTLIKDTSYLEPHPPLPSAGGDA